MSAKRNDIVIAGHGPDRERLDTALRWVADRFLLDSLPATGAGYGIQGARAVTPDRWLVEGDAVGVGPLAFDILHAPGHSPGSVVFVSRDARFALVGDVVFKGSVGRTDLFGGSGRDLMNSLLTKLLVLDDDTVVLPGHGAQSTIGVERRTNPFLEGLTL